MFVPPDVQVVIVLIARLHIRDSLKHRTLKQSVQRFKKSEECTPMVREGFKSLSMMSCQLRKDTKTQQNIEGLYSQPTTA